MNKLPVRGLRVCMRRRRDEDDDVGQSPKAIIINLPFSLAPHSTTAAIDPPQPRHARARAHTPDIHPLPYVQPILKPWPFEILDGPSMVNGEKFCLISQNNLIESIGLLFRVSNFPV